MLGRVVGAGGQIPAAAPLKAGVPEHIQNEFLAAAYGLQRVGGLVGRLGIGHVGVGAHIARAAADAHRPAAVVKLVGLGTAVVIRKNRAIHAGIVDGEAVSGGGVGPAHLADAGNAVFYGFICGRSRIGVRQPASIRAGDLGDAVAAVIGERGLGLIGIFYRMDASEIRVIEFCDPPGGIGYALEPLGVFSACAVCENRFPVHAVSHAADPSVAVVIDFDGVLIAVGDLQQVSVGGK